MKAMVFAAGIGSRLLPITQHVPKALVELDGQAMISWVLQRLHRLGISMVVVNVYHHAEQMIHFMDNLKYDGMEIRVSDERPQLLNTGGGLAKVKSWLKGDENVLLYNVDIISDIHLPSLLKAHEDTGAMATLAVMDRPSSRKLLFDQNNHLVGWRDHGKQQTRWVKEELTQFNELSFSGIHVVSPGVFDFMPSQSCFSIIDFYLNLAVAHPIIAYQHDNSFWTDVGKPADLDFMNTYLGTAEGIEWKKAYLSLS